MQAIAPKDNIEDNKVVSADPLKLARDKYYANNKYILRTKQKEYYDKIKETDDFKQRKKAYNQLYRDQHKTNKPKTPSGGRPRKYIFDIPEKTLADIIVEFPIIRE